MNEKLACLALAATVGSSALAYTDSIWISPAEGDPGDLVSVDVWLQYNGGGQGDSISAFDIPLTWDASVCSVEAITLGYWFRTGDWVDASRIDNQGMMGPPSVPKLTLSAYRSDSGEYVKRGTCKAGKIDFRVLESVVGPDSSCLDTLMEAFSPPVNLRFTDKPGTSTYVPSFSSDCVRYYPFTDSVWIVGGDGYPGDLVTIEIWLQYQGGGSGDSITAFDIPLTYNAAVCTVEAITLGPDFHCWRDQSRIDNRGVLGEPACPKILVAGWTAMASLCPWPVGRGRHLAATVDARILSTAMVGDSACFDTLMQAFTPVVHLGFVDRPGYTVYVPSFSSGCVRAVEYYCGDCNADGRITSADIVYMGNYIYGHGPDPYGQADVNLDGRITVADAIYLGNYIYRRGGEPCDP
jgi:hypothetical protein